MKKKPKECLDCQKPITICFSEVNQEKVTHTFMCDSCPRLASLLYSKPTESEQITSQIPYLECGHCQTSWKNFLESGFLGCSRCYEVFKSLLATHLCDKQAIAGRSNSDNTSLPLHSGREPTKSFEINPKLQIIALTEALNENLAKENYEEAAVLRDQIRQLNNNMDSHDHTK